MEVKEDPVGCPQCEGRVFYRKSTYFGRKVYYKVCNKCGWYRVYPKTEWIEICFGITPPEVEVDEEPDTREASGQEATTAESHPEDSPITENEPSSGSELDNETQAAPEPAPGQEEEIPPEPIRKRGRKRGRKPRKKPEEDPPSAKDTD